MRLHMHSMLNACGIGRIEHVSNSATAVRTLRKNVYDLILCEYDLGRGQDGQQLLEDLRIHQLIPLRTVFLIITAESAYKKVVSAAELAPNDYILKPFAVETLQARIGRAVEKLTALLPVYRMMEQSDLHEAIATCEASENKQHRYATDFMRLRAELHMSLGEPDVAERIYAQLAARDFPWARLGLARSLFTQHRFGEAEEILIGLLAESKQFMDVYDWLAKTYEATDRLLEAKQVLLDAVDISPHVVRRLRKLGEVALETGDVETAERSFQSVVAKAKYSDFRDPEDYVRLVQTMVQKGDAQQATAIIAELERSLDGMKKTPACRAISAALLHTHTGDAERAVEEVTTAVAACREAISLSNQTKIALAKSCLQHDMEDSASEVMVDVMNNTPDETAMAKAINVFEQAGRQDLAEVAAAESRRLMLELMSTGAAKANAGDYRGAVDILSAAVRRLPDNPQVVFNAAVAALKYLEHKGWDAKLAEQARNYIDTARRLDPTNPRLTPLKELYQYLLKQGRGKPDGY